MRPGRRNGGTTLVFEVSRPVMLTITIYRVYPSCERVGKLTIRAHRGLNRIRFNGRVRGRPLAEGGYRLVVRVRGARRNAATIPLVVVRGTASAAELRKARTTVVCADRFEYLASTGADAPGGKSGGALGVLSAIKNRVKEPFGAAAGAIAGSAQGLSDPVKRAVSDDRFNKPIVLTIVGLITLLAAFLGALVLAHLARAVPDDRR